MTFTRTARAAQTKYGLPDRVTLKAPSGSKIVSAGLVSNRFDRTIDATQGKSDRVLLESGVPGRGSRFVRFYATGKAGDSVEIEILAEKARTLKGSVALTPTKPEAP